MRRLLPTKAAQRAEAAQLSNLTIRQRLSHELDARKEQIAAILNALYEKAKRGDVPAARELRGWYDQGLGKPEGTSLDEGDVDKPLEAMTPGKRARLRAQVMARIAEIEAQAEPASGVGGEAPAPRPPSPKVSGTPARASLEPRASLSGTAQDRDALTSKALAEASTVPYATVFPHLKPLASRAATARDRPRASFVAWIDEATVAGFRGSLCDGRCARPAARQAPQP